MRSSDRQDLQKVPPYSLSLSPCLSLFTVGFVIADRGNLSKNFSGELDKLVIKKLPITLIMPIGSPAVLQIHLVRSPHQSQPVKRAASSHVTDLIEADRKSTRLTPV